MDTEDLHLKVKRYLQYFPDTGKFVSRLGRGRVVPGIEVGTAANSNGYLTLFFQGKRYYLHRLAYLYMTGVWPEHDIDHINRVRTDNRWCNLRAATRSENCRNNAASLKDDHGVTWDRARKKWLVGFTLANKRRVFGRFSSYIQAVEKAKEAKATLMQQPGEMNEHTRHSRG